MDKIKVEKTLDELVEALKNETIELCKESKDGRVNSISDEGIIIGLIKKHLSSEQYEEVRERYYCDIVIMDAPVNIKVSDFKGADNVSSNQGLVYALTGKTCGNNWKSIGKTLMSNDIDKDVDYYFLLVNKNKPGDIYWTSFKRLANIVPNGNNLPFQCCWDNNREQIERTYEEARAFLLNSLKASTEKRNLPDKIMKEVCEFYEC